MEITNLLTFTDRRQLREWFEQNHLSERCCWVACNRSKTAKPDTLPYIEIVEEALCFGWIDSTLKNSLTGDWLSGCRLAGKAAIGQNSIGCAVTTLSVVG